MNINKSKKSQLGIGDLFLAVSIFVVVIGAVVFIYNHYNVKFESRQSFNRMQISGMQITELLVKSKGVPENWELNSTETKLIGLAYDDRNLSGQKISGFINMSYNESKELLGIDYDFYFKLTDIEGNLLAKNGYNATGVQAVSIERRVLYNGENAIMSFVLWG